MSSVIIIPRINNPKYLSIEKWHQYHSQELTELYRRVNNYLKEIDRRLKINSYESFVRYIYQNSNRLKPLSL